MLPDRDMSFDCKNSLTIDGEKWRYVSQSPVRAGHTTNLVLQDTDVVSKDGTIKSYMRPGGFDHPVGNINQGKVSDVPRVNNARPLFQILRSLSVGFFVPQNYVMANESGFIDGRPCQILQTQPTNIRWSLWVDPSRSFSLVRYSLSSEGKILLTTDLTYTQSSEHGWVAVGWKIVETDRSGSLKRSTNATVTHWEINTPIPPNEFDLDFPPGTLVRDFTTTTEWGSTSQYIAREGGKKRIVSQGDRGATYEQLLASETGTARLPRGPSALRMWAIVICILLSLACIVVVLWQRRGIKAE
jgi:hypothetical protein